MTKLLYCARPEEGQSTSVAAEDLAEVFELTQRHPITWDAALGQDVPNPHYVEDAFLEWNDSMVGAVLSELGLDGRNISADGRAWPLEDVRAGIASFRESSKGEEPDGLDTAVHVLDRLVALGARHGGTHLVAV